MSSSDYFQLLQTTKDIVYRFKWLALFSHWVFQGIFCMDWTERLYKISIDVIITVIIYFILNRFVSPLISLIFAALISHTINYLFNSHVTSSLKFFGFFNHTHSELLSFGGVIGDRLSSLNSILFAGIWGGFARDQHSQNPDLDIFLVRKAGFFNGLSACTSVLIIRSMSLVKGVPIDIYVFDRIESLSRLRTDESPIILVDQFGILISLFPSANTFKNIEPSLITSK
jgi:hypothetical protein